jgi:hypothetical protein
MQIKLTFNEPLNHSLQVGDTIWYVTTGQSGGYETAGVSQTNKLGTVEEISNQYRAHQITVSNYTSTVAPTNLEQSFIMFSKDNKANLSNLKGYYALARFENNSRKKAELYAVGSEISISSK